MQKSQKILIGVGAAVVAVLAVAAIAGPGIYRDFIAAPAAEAPSLGANENLMEDTEGSTLVPEKLVGEWQIAEGSEAGYRVDEVLGGTDVTVTGRTSQVTGTFTIGASGLTLDATDLTVDIASIETDSSQRDSYFRGTAMRADEFPTARFVLTEPVTLDTAPAWGDVVQADVMGDLTLAGVTQRVTAEVSVRSDGQETEIAGAIPITFEDFGVTAPNLGFVQVEPAGFVEFQILARQAK